MTTAIEEKIQQAIGQGVFPGAQCLVASGEEVLFESSQGRTSSERGAAEVTPATFFDVASLTKPIVTTSALLLLMHREKIRLDARVVDFLPDFDEGGKNKITLRHLLKHTSGLAAWRPYFEEMRRSQPEIVGTSAARGWVLSRICQEELEIPTGYRRLYSDLGFMLLGELVERISGIRLDRFFANEVCQPLGLRGSFFNPLGDQAPEAEGAVFAATEDCPWREKVLVGEVDDDNAYAMGGVAGHAGLFQTARDCHLFVGALLKALRGEGSFFSPDLLMDLIGPRHKIKGGWDTPSPENSQAGRYFSPQSIGHLGFTGCSLWIDLGQNFHIILFTNRIHPSRNNEKIKEWRPLFHDIAYETIIRKS
ncbi:MAG: serine hydrolase [Deltaproteobacteria bacterium]|nr:serine hydrolase [Deltaproteobacteria bacterium]